MSLDFNACICTLMKHYIEAVPIIQTIKRPIQHRIELIIRNSLRQIKLMDSGVFM